MCLCLCVEDEIQKKVPGQQHHGRRHMLPRAWRRRGGRWGYDQKEEKEVGKVETGVGTGERENKKKKNRQRKSEWYV